MDQVCVLCNDMSLFVRPYIALCICIDIKYNACELSVACVYSVQTSVRYSYLHATHVLVPMLPSLDFLSLTMPW